MAARVLVEPEALRDLETALVAASGRNGRDQHQGIATLRS